MNRFCRAVRRIVFAASLALILTVALMPSGRVSSSTAYYSYQITYYSDATYTQEVGSRFVDCNGHGGTLEGQSSPYQQSEIVDVCCRDPGHNGWVPC
jgi:hypothetical protein